jgi:hypothetical protein
MTYDSFSCDRCYYEGETPCPDHYPQPETENPPGLIPLGTKTQWGNIAMVGFTGGERYYWMKDKHGCVSMMPAFIVEQQEKN